MLPILKHSIVAFMLCCAIFQGGYAAAELEEDLSPFLAPAKFVDSGHPAIANKAKELTAGCVSAEEKARRLFEFVRDTYTTDECPSFVASEVLTCGGNSCRQRSILLAALCRAAGIPARLHLQKVTLKNWRREDGTVIADYIFAHGITGIYLRGRWLLYETVGNGEKWRVWTQDEARVKEMPVPFSAERDCLFRADDRILIETLPVFFADRTPELISLIERIDSEKSPTTSGSVPGSTGALSALTGRAS
ncbi:MAG: transglutaminase domain-containing protein [Candidatus Aminicenantales bacterium]